jgi:predicted ATPase
MDDGFCGSNRTVPITGAFRQRLNRGDCREGYWGGVINRAPAPPRSSERPGTGDTAERDACVRLADSVQTEYPVIRMSVDTNRLVVISGCSGGGKTTLLIELGRRGYVTVDEPGRRVVKEEMLGEGLALPWVDETAFARRTLALALADRATANRVAGWVFFDRGLIDAAAALQHLAGEPTLATLGPAHRYHPRVFLTPPWPEIYVTDLERRHDLNAAIAEYQRLLDVYPSLGYEATILPKVGAPERADFVLHSLAEYVSRSPPGLEFRNVPAGRRTRRRRKCSVAPGLP